MYAWHASCVSDTRFGEECVTCLADSAYQVSLTSVESVDSLHNINSDNPRIVQDLANCFVLEGYQWSNGRTQMFLVMIGFSVIE